MNEGVKEYLFAAMAEGFNESIKDSDIKQLMPMTVKEASLLAARLVDLLDDAEYTIRQIILMVISPSIRGLHTSPLIRRLSGPCPRVRARKPPTRWKAVAKVLNASAPCE